MQTAVNFEGNQELQDRTNEILTKYGLDFTIEKELLSGKESGRETDFYGLFNSKSGKALCTVKKDYRVTQTSEVVMLVLTAINSYENLRITKAGSLNDGRKVFIQLQVEGFSRVNNELIERYITIIDSNDKTHCLSVGVGDITLSCSNQFAYFYAKGMKLQHANTIEEKLKQLPLLINAALSNSEKQIGTYERMSQVEVTENDVHAIVKHVLGYDKVYTSVEDLSKKTKKSIEQMDKLYSNIADEMSKKGYTRYGLFQGVTWFTTHELKHVKRENGDTESLLVGRAYNMNQKAFDFLTKDL